MKAPLQQETVNLRGRDKRELVPVNFSCIAEPQLGIKACNQ